MLFILTPPYNTGNKDFIYNDRFVDKEDKYRHSKWLNFMEKRLNLASELLKKDGVIFISIDDNEVFNLKILCDKIFGEDNFIANLPTIMNLKGNNDQFGFSGTHEYTLVYTKNIKEAKINFFDIDEEEVLKNWLEDEYGLYKEADNLRATGANAPRSKRPNLWYPIFLNKDSREFYITDNDISLDDSHIKILPINPEGEELSWYWGKKTFNEKKYNLILKKTKNGWQFYRKQRPELGDVPTKKPKSFFYKTEYSTSTATAQLKNMFNLKIFNNPKPLELIKDIIFLGTKKDSTILDFFAGSGTTAHAVMELNKQDGGNRKFIICTNNESNICENVTYPRIQKVINGYTTPKNKSIDGLGGNLKYFKTELLPKGDSYSQMRINLTKECSEMLCIKEGIYNLKKEDSDFKIYISNDSKKYLCIYFNTEDNSLKKFLTKLKTIKEDKVVYMFSDSEEVDKTIFRGVKNFEVEAIPQKILNIYKQLVKQNISPKTNTIFMDLEKSKRRIFEEKDKDDGASKLRVVLEQIIEFIAHKNGINLNDYNSIARVNTKLKDDGVFSKVLWKENETYLTIGNDASHGDYESYDMKQVENFYLHIQTLIKNFGIGK